MIELPPILKRENFSSDLEFILYAHKVFMHDFIYYPPKLYSETVRTREELLENGYNKTFWHIITEGDHRIEDRIDNERLVRIPWINPIIEGQPDIDWLLWEKPQSKKDNRILIYCPKNRYLIVIDKRLNEKIVFWTAFPVKENHYERKLLKEYEHYKNAKGPTV